MLNRFFYVFNETSTTLVNPSPATSIIFDDEENKQQDIPFGLTELGIIHWNRDKKRIPDWKKFPKQKNKCQGLKNLVKMLNSEVGFIPPNTLTNTCNDCGCIFQWFNNCGITLRKRKFYYNVRCNGVCLKENISIPVKVLVNSNGRCHNPRCSGVNPTFFWEKNQKLYCSVECCDGYQEWHNEVSIIYPISPNHKIQ